jgi:hypothetical protein
MKNKFDSMSEKGDVLEINSKQVVDSFDLNFTDVGTGMNKDVAENFFLLYCSRRRCRVWVLD